MEYYELLGLAREPFADTANPYFLYASPDHDDCLSRLEIAIRMGRGLALVLGDVGTGKTTMALSLEEHLRNDSRFCVGAIYDPAFLTESELLEGIFDVFGVPYEADATLAQRIDAFQEFLQARFADESRSVVLLVDESQKISPANLELLRLLLNSQHPERRLLNVVLFGQLELLPAIERNGALKDRINLLYVIKPLDRSETLGLITHRLQKAGQPPDADLFTSDALEAIYEASGGHPRKIVLLCQEAIQESFMHDSGKVDLEVLNAVLQRRKSVDDFISSYLGTHAQGNVFDPHEHTYVPAPQGEPLVAPSPSLPEPVPGEAAEPEPGSAGPAPLGRPSSQAQPTAVEVTSTVASALEATPLPQSSVTSPAGDIPTPVVATLQAAAGPATAPGPAPAARKSFWQWLFGS